MRDDCAIIHIRQFDRLFNGRQVLSGDTVVIRGGNGSERTLSLAHVTAPRLHRKGPAGEPDVPDEVSLKRVF